MRAPPLPCKVDPDMSPLGKTLLWSMLACAATAVQAGEEAPHQDGGDEPATGQAAGDAMRDLDAITVYGRRPDDTILTIPQSIAVFQPEVIAMTPATTVGDMIRFVPTASRDGSTLNSFGDDYLIRGFAASQTINGLGFNRVAHARDLANVERIEVLKGPASVLYGQMEPGAVINVVTKQALDTYQAEVGVELGSYDNRRLTADVTGPLGDRIRGRLNLAYQDAESFIDFWDVERLFVAPNIAFDLSPGTELVFEGTWAKNDWGSFQNGRPASGAFLFNPHGRYDESFNPDEPGIGFTHRDSAYANLRLSHALNDDLKFRASYSHTRNEADFKEMFVLGLQEDFRTLDRAIFVGRDTWENDRNLLLDLSGKVETGALTHNFVFGINHRRFDGSRPTRFYLTTPLDLFEPVYGLAGDEDVALRGFRQDFRAIEGFIQDRIEVSERLHLLAGVRYTDSEQRAEFISVDGESTHDSLDETNWSSQFGVLYELGRDGSIYANRSESFVPQSGTSSGGRPFDAETGTQHEIGTRFDIGDSGLTANAALFNIRKDNLLTTDPDNPGFEAALGEVESRGFEISASGYLQPGWFLGAGYGHTRTEILRNFDGLAGNRLRNTPEDTFSMQTRYDIGRGAFEGLGLGATLEYVARRYGDDENSFELPAHTRLDLAAFYQINPRMQVDLMLNNVTDEEIYAEGYDPARVIQEPGRTFLLRFKLRSP